TDSWYPVSARMSVSTTAPSAMPVVSPAVQTPPKMPARPGPLVFASWLMTSGSIAMGSVCMPAYAAPASATGAYSHGPGIHTSMTSERAARPNSTDAAPNASSLPVRREMSDQTGAQTSAGAMSATQRKVVPLVPACSIHLEM